MEVVLLEDVKALGKKGQIVKVSDGYGRNFILTKKLGIEATPKNLNDLKLQKANENGGYYVINANAKYNNTTEQYLEYYNGFTTYSYKSSSDAAYVFYFYLIDEGTPSVHIRADESVTENVAQWSGTADYKTAGVTADTGIAGDSLNANAGYGCYIFGGGKWSGSGTVYRGPKHFHRFDFLLYGRKGHWKRKQ